LPTKLTAEYSYSSGTLVNHFALTIDSNENLWFIKGSGGSADLYPVNTLNPPTSLTNAFSGGSLPNFAQPTLVADGSGNVYGCLDTDQSTSAATDLDVFNASSSPTWIDSGVSPAPPPYQLQNGAGTSTVTGNRGCGSQLVLDGQGHIFAVSNFHTDPSQLPATNIDEFTTAGAAISPLLNGYTGTSASEPPTLQTDLNFGGAGAGEAVPGVSAAIDGSGNLWVLNVDTTGTTGTSPNYSSTTTPGNVLVEYVGIGAPVVTPTSAALQNTTLGVRP
jgi:hypothetical protein